MYGGSVVCRLHEERHLHSVRLERRSGLTWIVAPAELPRLGVGGGAHVSSGGGSTLPNAAVGELRRSAYVRLVAK